MTNQIWKDFHVVYIEPINSQWWGVMLADGEGTVMSVTCKMDDKPFEGELIRVPYYYVGSDFLNFYSCGLYSPTDMSSIFKIISDEALKNPQTLKSSDK